MYQRDFDYKKWEEQDVGLNSTAYKFSKLKIPLPLVITITFCLVSYPILFEESIWIWVS